MIVHTIFVDDLVISMLDVTFIWIKMDTFCDLTFVDKLEMGRPKVKMSQRGTAQRLEHVCLQAENNFMLINVDD